MLDRTLEKKGPKAIIGNLGFARFIKVRRGAVSVNAGAVSRDARLDGKLGSPTSQYLSTWTGSLYLDVVLDAWSPGAAAGSDGA